MASFPSVSHALRFERLLLAAGRQIKLIPVPRVISSSCGLAARFSREELPQVSSMLANGQAEVEKIYFFEGEGKQLRVTPVAGPWEEQ